MISLLFHLEIQVKLLYAIVTYLYVVSSQMHLDSPEALGVLNTLFETVAPSSLRPVDMLLKSMFTTPVTMVRDLFSYLNMLKCLDSRLPCLSGVS